MSEKEPHGALVGGLVEIRTTFGTRDAALACGTRLVEAKLAACAQVEGPISSTYAWQGAVERADEWRCVCKTTIAARDECVAALVAGHPYETPQIVVIPAEASAAYAAWVADSVRPGLRAGL
jgi:periplasmic divalent cation tolerance protein